MYDLIIVDTSPVAIVSDAMPLVQRVDGVIVVCWLDASRRDRALHLRNELESLSTQPLGLVVNRAKAGVDGDYGYNHGVEQQQVTSHPALPASFDRIDAADGAGQDSDVREMLREWIEAMRHDGKPRAEAQSFLELFKEGDRHLDLLDEIYADGRDGTPSNSRGT